MVPALTRTVPSASSTPAPATPTSGAIRTTAWTSFAALGITTTDEETREGYYKEAQQLIIDECPNLWFASPMSYLFTSANLKGYEPFAANAGDFTEAYFE